MIIQANEEWLPVYEALSSQVRLRIINLLASRPMNIKELAAALELSSAIMTMHVRKLEQACIVRTERVPGNGAMQKRCHLAMDRLEIIFPDKDTPMRKHHDIHLPVGHYIDCQIQPTCGLATTEKMVGHFDDPKVFWDPERMNAGLLWFTQGYIEYRIPNPLLISQSLTSVEICMEICSEAPGVNPDWPSDISFTLNGVNLGYWTSPGDFGDQRGRYTPAWIAPTINQYGLYKVLRVGPEGCFMDGERMSAVTADMLDPLRKTWSFRIGVREDAQHVGGVTLFGRGFGNYGQDMLFRLFYDN